MVADATFVGVISEGIACWKAVIVAMFFIGLQYAG